MNGSFAGKHVVVTGGAGALGTAVVTRLLEAGAEVSVPVFAESELKRFPHASHEKVRVVRGVDLTHEPAVESFYRTATEGRGLWASIQVAGGFGMAPVEETSKADFVSLMQTNALTCFLCCREAVRVIRAGETGGRLVNVAARPALIPDQGAGMASYTASKAAVAALTRALAAEVVKDGILVNAVVPSIMDTHSNRKSMPEAEFDAWPKVEQVAATIVFLASAENSVTRGGLVPVYGQS